MMALRRLWWVLVLGALATLGMACSSSSGSKTAKIGNGVTAGEQAPAPAPASNGGPAQAGAPAGGSSTAQSTGGAKAPKATAGSPGQNGTLCSGCQSGNDAVKLSDADGYTFETGEAEAGRIQAGQPAPGGEHPATFDAGEGMKGTTGSSNLRPH
jgi:uncharacterized iron-regulated membrane protein